MLLQTAVVVFCPATKRKWLSDWSWVSCGDRLEWPWPLKVSIVAMCAYMCGKCLLALFLPVRQSLWNCSVSQCPCLHRQKHFQIDAIAIANAVWPLESRALFRRRQETVVVVREWFNRCAAKKVHMDQSLPATIVILLLTPKEGEALLAFLFGTVIRSCTQAHTIYRW